MQRLEVSGAVRPPYGSLGVKGLISHNIISKRESKCLTSENFRRKTKILACRHWPTSELLCSHPLF